VDQQANDEDCDSYESAGVLLEIARGDHEDCSGDHDENAENFEGSAGSWRWICLI
jgi:hypothetical protein